IAVGTLGVRARCWVVLSASLAASQQVRSQSLPVRGYPGDALAARAAREQSVRETPDPKRIRGYIRAMTAVPHAAGTPGSKRVAEWALDRFKEWGFDAKIETYEALLPAPIEQVLEIRGPKPWRAQLKEDAFPEDPDSN